MTPSGAGLLDFGFPIPPRESFHVDGPAHPCRAGAFRTQIADRAARGDDVLDAPRKARRQTAGAVDEFVPASMLMNNDSSRQNDEYEWATENTPGYGLSPSPSLAPPPSS